VEERDYTNTEARRTSRRQQLKGRQQEVAVEIRIKNHPAQSGLVSRKQDRSTQQT